MNKQAEEVVYGEGVEVYFTFKLTDEVVVSVDWTLDKPTTAAELEVEARNRLERAGLPRDLEQAEA